MSDFPDTPMPDSPPSQEPFMVVYTGQPLVTYYNNVIIEELLEKSPKKVVLNPYSGPNDEPWSSDSLREITSKYISPIAYFPIGTVNSDSLEYQEAQKLGILGPEDPEWPGDYAVEFWDRKYRWFLKRRILQLAKLGFDGIAFDVIDAFTRPWYVDNYGWSTVYDKTWEVLVDLSSRATRIGMEIFAITGSAMPDSKMVRLAKKYDITILQENVIADDNGVPVDDPEYNYAVNRLREYDRVITIEYITEDELYEDRVIKERVTELFLELEQLVEMYLAPKNHDSIGPAVVKSQHSPTLG